jgi:hypothetical protein
VGSSSIGWAPAACTLRLLVPLLAQACTPGADRGDPDPVRPDDTGSPVDTTPDTGEPWWDQPAGDADGDGWTAAEGDCDDGEPSVNPGWSSDPCDGLDNDCDGAVDEDAAGDEWEPDDSQGTQLGSMDDGGSLLLFPTLHSADDVDRFRVRLDDSDFSWFSLEAWVYPPTGVDVAVEILWVADPDGVDQGSVASVDATGEGGIECADWGGDAWLDDGGTYEVVVRSSGGSSCSTPYTLEILAGDW